MPTVTPAPPADAAELTTVPASASIVPIACP
jgi:hypothetical protein